MIRPDRFVRQISRHIRREKRLSLGSFLVLAIVLILIDLFWIASGTITQQYHELLGSVRMELFISDAVPDSALAVMELAVSSVEGEAAVAYVSREEAAQFLENELGAGILDGLQENPLPRSFVIFFDQSKSLDQLDALEKRLQRLEGIEAIEFGRPWIEKVEKAARNFRRVGYIIGGIILFVVLLTMANTNRLTARSKSTDFFQLKLLGAGPSYLLYPFLAEGFLSAFIAAVLGWAAMYYLAGRVSVATIALVLPSVFDVAIYAVLAGLTGTAGAYLGIRRLLIS